MWTTHEKLRVCPPGSVTARGWIREQLLRNKAGMGGNLAELEPEMFATPYVTGAGHEGWGIVRAGWGGEISGNFWYGFVQLAFALDDAELIAKARRWVEGVLANQRKDGYLGTYTETDNRQEDFNAWGSSSGMSALQAWYDATSEPAVLDAVHRGLLWFCEHWSGDRKTRYVGQSIVTNMAWCYRLTGDERLRAFIDDYFDFINRKDLYCSSINAMRGPELVYNSYHAAALALMPRVAATGYLACGRPEYLDAAVNLMKKIEDKLLLPNGGIASNTEYLSPRAANTETEYCTFSYFHNALLWMSAVSGEARYFDISERIALNGGQGARKKDEKAITYFASGNQIFSTMNSDFMGDDNGAYTPCHPTSCCTANSVWTMPEYLLGMALTDRDGNLYISTYGPARIQCGGLTLESDTLYPFRDTVEYAVHTEGETPASHECDGLEKTIHFRIPSWCEDAEITVNGLDVPGPKTPGGWFTVARRWREGDVIRLRLPMRVTIKRLDDTDSWKHYPLVVEYGPLVFSLPIPEKWTAIEGHPRTKLPEGWSWYNLEPDIPWNDPRGDLYEQHGLRKFNITWNVAVDEAVDPSTVRVEHHDGGYVWEHPPLTLTLPGYKALYSYAPYIRKTHVVYQSPIDVQEPLTLTLVPYGCACLRIAYFPRAKV